MVAREVDVESLWADGGVTRPRSTLCLTCDRPFTPRPNHPAIESAWCDACLAILRPMWHELVWAEMQPAGEWMIAMDAALV